MQNRSARVITGKSYESRSSEILTELGWQPLMTRMKMKKVTFIYNIRNNENNESMTNMFQISLNIAHNLRSNEVNFQIPKPTTNFMTKSISYSGVSLWNNLPTTAQELGLTIGRFKDILIVATSDAH